MGSHTPGQPGYFYPGIPMYMNPYYMFGYPPSAGPMLPQTGKRGNPSKQLQSETAQVKPSLNIAGKKSSGVSAADSQEKLEKSDKLPTEPEIDKKSEKKKESFEQPPFHPYQFFGKYPPQPGYPFMPFAYPPY